MKLVSGPCPVKGLLYPKVDEKPPFQTRAEIERQLDGLTEDQQEELWDALYLTLPEIEVFLAEVKAAWPPTPGSTRWSLRPAYASASDAGAELESVLEAPDVDFEAMTLTIRERKRDQRQANDPRQPAFDRKLVVDPAGLAGGPSRRHVPVRPIREEVARSKKRWSRTTGHTERGGAANLAQGPSKLVTYLQPAERPGILLPGRSTRCRIIFAGR